jgi:hypothetical protein
MNATDTVKTNYNKFDNLPQGYLSYIQDEIKKRDNVVQPITKLSRKHIFMGAV